MSIIREQLLALLREGFEGPAHHWSYFTGEGWEAGMFGTLEPLSAGEASRPSGPGGSTVAAHVHHMVFALAASSAWLEGDRTRRDWQESWRVTAVDEDAWARLQADLRRGYEELARVIETVNLADEMTLGAAVGAIAHAAYHLGAIRQKVPAAGTA